MFILMRFKSYAAPDMRGITDFVNENNIPKDMILDIFQNQDGLYIINYYTED